MTDRTTNRTRLTVAAAAIALVAVGAIASPASATTYRKVMGPYPTAQMCQIERNGYFHSGAQVSGCTLNYWHVGGWSFLLTK